MVSGGVFVVNCVVTFGRKKMMPMPMPMPASEASMKVFL
jgi:hypothetical protein